MLVSLFLPDFRKHLPKFRHGWSRVAVEAWVGRVSICAKERSRIYWICMRHWGCFPGGTSDREPACQRRRHKKCRVDPLVGKIPWRTAWQPTPVFFPGESQGQRSLMGHSPQGHDWSTLACTRARGTGCWASDPDVLLSDPVHHDVRLVCYKGGTRAQSVPKAHNQHVEESKTPVLSFRPP